MEVDDNIEVGGEGFDNTIWAGGNEGILLIIIVIICVGLCLLLLICLTLALRRRRTRKKEEAREKLSRQSLAEASSSYGDREFGLLAATSAAAAGAPWD